jgi:hypothetical protein
VKETLKLDDEAYMDAIEAELFAATMTRRDQGDKVVGVYCVITPKHKYFSDIFLNINTKDS